MIDEVIKVPTVATVSCAAYRERIHRLEAERDRLREALKLFVKLEDVQRHYPIEVVLARAVLGETEGKE
jgi:uncharacterized protein (UPF0335 family)